jgi:hypothetical protein
MELLNLFLILLFYEIYLKSGSDSPLFLASEIYFIAFVS